MADKKGTAVLALALGGKPKGKPMSEEPDGDEEYDSEAEALAGEDLAAALKSGDGAEIMAALKAAMDFCK